MAKRKSWPFRNCQAISKPCKGIKTAMAVSKRPKVLKWQVTPVTLIPGRMEKDLHGDIVDVHLAPGIDVNATNLNSICHLLTIIKNLVTLSVCQVKVDLNDLKEQFPLEVKEVR